MLEVLSSFETFRHHQNGYSASKLKSAKYQPVTLPPLKHKQSMDYGPIVDYFSFWQLLKAGDSFESNTEFLTFALGQHLQVDGSFDSESSQHIHQYLISIIISKGHFVQSSINKVVSEWVTDFGGRWSDLGLIKSIFFVKSCLFLSDRCLDLSTLYVSFCTLIFFKSCNFSKSHASFSCVSDHQAVSSKGVGRVWGSRYSAVKAIKKFCQGYEAKLCSTFLRVW